MTVMLMPPAPACSICRRAFHRTYAFDNVSTGTLVPACEHYKLEGHLYDLREKVAPILSDGTDQKNQSTKA